MILWENFVCVYLFVLLYPCAIIKSLHRLTVAHAEEYVDRSRRSYIRVCYVVYVVTNSMMDMLNQVTRRYT